MQREQRRPVDSSKSYQTPGFAGPQGILNQQRDENYQTADRQFGMNNINQSDAYGGRRFTRNADGSISQDTYLSDPQKNILAGQQQNEMGLLGQQQNAINQFGQTPGLNFNAPGMQQVDMANDQTRGRVEDAYFNRSKRLLDQQFGDQQNAVTADLRARGYQYGGQDYNSQMQKQVTDPRNRAMQDAADAAVQAGGNEMQRMNTMQLGNRNQGIQEQLTMRNQPLQEASALTGMQRGVTQPNANPFYGTNLNPVDVQGMGSQMAGMAHDRWMMKNTPRGGGGGGMSFGDWAQRQQFGNQMQQDNMILAAALAGQNQPGSPSPWMQAFQGMAPGLGAGLGSWAAGAF